MLTKICVAFGLLFAIVRIEAAIVSFLPSDKTATFGNDFSLEVRGSEFSTGITGGGFDLDYDATVVHITDVTINTVLFSFASSPGTWNNETGELRGAGFTSFLGELFEPPDASFLIATIDFSPVGAGSSLLDLEQGTVEQGALNWTDFFGTEINDQIAYQDGTASVSAMPLPAAGWLLAAGLVVLAMVGPRHRVGLPLSRHRFRTILTRLGLAAARPGRPAVSTMPAASHR